ncbi:MAG TPA: hypothetical protein VIL03_00760 [Clostridia bacterium]
MHLVCFLTFFGCVSQKDIDELQIQYEKLDFTELESRMDSFTSELDKTQESIDELNNYIDQLNENIDNINSSIIDDSSGFPWWWFWGFY